MITLKAFRVMTVVSLIAGVTVPAAMAQDCYGQPGGSSSGCPLPASFTACVGYHGQGATCTLGVAKYNGTLVPWLVNSTILVWRSNITIQGDPSAVLQTGLLRNSSSVIDLVQVGSGISGVTFKNLVFNGNRTNIGPNTQDIDLDLLNAGPDTYIQNCEFAFSAYTEVAAKAYTYISSTSFWGGGYYGLLTYAPNNSGVTNISVQNSTFLAAGSNAILLQAGANNSTINNTQFFYNHEQCPDGYSGGQLAVGWYTSSVSVTSNYFEGGGPTSRCPNGQVADGLEMYGTSHQVAGNTFIDEAGNGLFLMAGCFSGPCSTSVSVTNNTVQSNSQNGIAIAGQNFTPGAIPTCYAGHTYSFTVSGNIITSNSQWGVDVYGNGCAGLNVASSGNTINSNGNDTGGAADPHFQ